MYMAIIYGYQEVAAFSESEEKAKQLAIQKKRSFCKDDLDIWNWDSVTEYYGSSLFVVEEGKVIML